MVQNEINTLVFLVKKAKESKVCYICRYGIKFFFLLHWSLHQRMISLNLVNNYFFQCLLVEQRWSDKGEEKGGLLFHAHLSHCGLLEETSPCGAQALFPAPPQPYLTGKGRLLSGHLHILLAALLSFSVHMIINAFWMRNDHSALWWGFLAW